MNLLRKKLTDNPIRKPPKAAEFLLKFFLLEEDYYEKPGDFEEGFYLKIEKKGIFRARVWYWTQLLKWIPVFIKNSVIWRIIMFGNYFKISVRNIRKHKGFSAINVLGLSIGMACCLLILLFLLDDLSYDKFHKNSDNLYQIITESNIEGKIRKTPNAPAPLAQTIRNQIPEVINTARMAYVGGPVFMYNEKSYYENSVCFADPSLFEMFDFPFVKGDPETALSNPLSAVIDETTAGKYFGVKNPVGEVLRYNNETDLVVTGVIKDVPYNSTIRFNIVLPFEYNIPRQNITNWKVHSYKTYLLLRDYTSCDEVDRMLTDIAYNYSEKHYTYMLQKMSDTHLYSLDGSGFIEFYYVFFPFSFLVLLIGCINFINLSTARSGARSLEIGLRKVVGANRKDIILQCLGESSLLACLAFILAIIFVIIAIPHLNNWSAKELTLDFTRNPALLIGFIVITVITGLLSGSYPAFYLSSFQPVKVLKGVFNTGTKKIRFRRIMVVTQFAFAVIFIICAYILNEQFRYMINKNPGFNKNNMILLPVNNDIVNKYEILRDEILRNPEIVNVSAGSTYPAGSLVSTQEQIEWEEKDPALDVRMCYISVDQNFINTYEMEIIQGRNFSIDYSADTTNYILNEAAVRVMGIESPIGKYFSFYGRPGTIIGIVKDFHYQTMDRKIFPLIIRKMPERYFRYVFVKAAENNSGLPGIVSYLEDTWSKVLPGHPFEYSFLDVKFDKETRDGMKTMTILKYITFFIIFISCMGLFGLASYLTDMQTKEIAIRKTLGAKVNGLVLYLSREFIKCVLVANLIALPAAWFIKNLFMQLFAYRAETGFGIFVIAAILSVIIAFLTVSYRVIKAAIANPIDSLRYE
jgi:ABC-type antimicrobial peptide transport system permease subunit